MYFFSTALLMKSFSDGKNVADSEEDASGITGVKRKHSDSRSSMIQIYPFILIKFYSF